MAEDVLLTALYSISDNNSFLLFNRDPITRMIQYLKVRICPHHTSTQSIGLSMHPGFVADQAGPVCSSLLSTSMSPAQC